MRDLRLPAALLVLLATPLVAAEAPFRGAVDLEIEVGDAPPASDGAAVTAVPVFAGERVADAVGGPAAARVDALELLSDKEHETLPLISAEATGGGSVWLLRAGPEADLDGAALRRLGGVAAREVRRRAVKTLVFRLRGDVPPAEAAAAVVEGVLDGLFDAGIHKTGREAPALRRLRLSGIDATTEVRTAVERAQVRARAVQLARSLGLEPGNEVYPEVLAGHARRIAAAGGLEIEVVDEKGLVERGFGGIWAVGKGSARPPRLIVLRYRAPEPSGVTLALVGKGVCFDSGGLSLKTYDDVHEMKNDLGGGAAVLAAMEIVAAERPGVDVLALVPAVENMPDGGAQRQGDVFTGYNGKTVEVMSTDAEGRLILSDALAYAVELGATHLVDVATLTGTVIRAVGDHRTGAFSNDDAFYARFADAAERAGELVWRLPIDEEHARGITDSLVADLNETGGKAGASIGARFLSEFVAGRPWIHLDIAGTSWPERKVPYRDEGPTGVMTRTLAELAHELAASGR